MTYLVPPTKTASAAAAQLATPQAAMLATTPAGLARKSDPSGNPCSIAINGGPR